MAKGLLDSLFDSLINSIFDEKWKGKRGESLTARELKLVNFFGRNGKILKNVYIPKDNGETTEIDVLYITQKGIFIFESKNYSGWIFGDEKSRNWTASLPNGQKNRFFNPIIQNKVHLKWMGKYIGEDIPLFSIIVFSERCELKKITVTSDDIKVIKRDYTYATVKNIWDSHSNYLLESEVDEIYEKLSKLTNISEALKVQHIENINRRYKNTNTAENNVEKINENGNKRIINKPVNDDITIPQDTVTPGDMICPKCGMKLILRTAKKGSNAGNQFYGCSSFPKCRYTKNIGS